MKTIRSSRFVFFAAIVVALGFVAAAPASGAGPTIDRFTNEIDEVRPAGTLCTFPVALQGTADVSVKDFGDRIKTHVEFDIAATNLENGVTVHDRSVFNETVDFVAGTYKIAGQPVRVIGDAGIVADRGVVVFSLMTGEVVKIGGPHPTILDSAAPCELLT